MSNASLSFLLYRWEVLRQFLSKFGNEQWNGRDGMRKLSAILLLATCYLLLLTFPCLMPSNQRPKLFLFLEQNPKLYCHLIDVA